MSTGVGRQSAAELTGALVAVWAAHHLLPLGREDAFRTTLVVLPAVMAALRALGRHAPPRRGPRHPAGLWEAAALVALVLLVLTRLSLGLAATDWFLAAGFVLLLGHRLARLLLRWRPALATGQRPHAAFFLMPLVVYLAILPWQAGQRSPDGDEPFYLLVTHSLAHDLDVELRNNYAAEDWRAFMERPIEPQPGDPRGPGGELYSRHNLLLPLVLAPAYLAGGRWGAMAMMAVLTAALAWELLALARRRGRGGAALLAYAVFAFSPPTVLYSYQIWIEVPAALVTLVAFARVCALPRGASPRQLLGLALWLALLPLLKLRLGLVALGLAVLAVVRVRPSARGLGALAGGLAMAFGALLLHNQLRFGNLLKIHQWGELDLTSGSFEGAVLGALGMFYDAAFGLFPHAPVWALLIPALWLLLRRRDPLPRDLAILALPYLAALVPRAEWYGGWSPPFRYPLVFLPLFALLLVPLFEHRQRPGLRLLLTALGALTAVLTVIWIVEPGWTYNFADGRTRMLDLAGTRLDADVARLFASTVRPRPATWIWPLLSLLLIPFAGWRGGRARWRRAAGHLGFALVLAVASVLPLLARQVPTRVIELEDAWVKKERGRGFPDTWVRERPRYTSGWIVPSRGRAVAQVAPGGASARLRLHVRTAKPGVRSRLVLAAGATRLAEVEVPDGGWREIELGPFPWPAGEPLVLAGGGAHFPGRVAVDRVEWIWE